MNDRPFSSGHALDYYLGKLANACNQREWVDAAVDLYRLFPDAAPAVMNEHDLTICKRIAELEREVERLKMTYERESCGGG